MEKKDYEKSLEDNLKKGKWEHSSIVAEECVKVLGKLIADSEWHTTEELLKMIKEKGRNLIESHPSQTVIGNMVKRVLKIIREEFPSAIGKGEGNMKKETIQNMLLAGYKIDYSIPLTAENIQSLKELVEDHLRELLTEMEASPDNIASQALDHILTDDVIMTAGKSKTVEKFLKKAGAKRKFQVIVAEGAPFYHGHELAKRLSEADIETILIQDCAMFAIMPRVTKVVIGAHSVMANGGLKAPCGMQTLALSAKHQSVPLIVCVGTYKLTTQHLFSPDQEGFNHLKSPDDILPYDESLTSKIEIVNPAFDYVQPELISLLVSNIGGSSTSYVNRLCSELYHPDDYDI